MDIPKKQFLSKLQDLSRSQSPHRIFSDWLEIAALTLHQVPYQSGEIAKDTAFEKIEQSYLEHIQPYSRNELNVFSKLLSLTLAVHHNGYSDFLGEIAGEAELLNKGIGQFFTPYYLCKAIARMTFGNIQGQVERQGIITAADPACGAGALIIAGAEEIASQGIDPRAYVQFDCTDISRDAFNMADIQLCAQNLQAVVRYGNSLSGEYWEHRPTPQIRLFDQWLKVQQRSQQLVKAVRSLLEEESTPLLARSATLFDVDEFTVESQSRKRERWAADIVLDKQMNLFDA
jgi:type I restriction-modification system DNA methylase subunit